MSPFFLKHPKHSACVLFLSLIVIFMPTEKGKVFNAFIHSENMYTYRVPESSQTLMQRILFICSSSQLGGESQLIHCYIIV